MATTVAYQVVVGLHRDVVVVGQTTLTNHEDLVILLDLEKFSGRVITSWL
jgi:hypothetical protein